MNRYSSIPVEKSNSDSFRKKGIQFYAKTVKYPEIPYNQNDIYVLTDAGDNLPELAYKFYNDTTLYWVISVANPNAVSFGSIFPTPGTQLRIPQNISNIIDLFNKLNSL